MSRAGDVSNSGVLVGESDDRAFVSTGGALRDLGTLGGDTSSARAVNDRGVFVDETETATGVNHAAAWVPVPVPTLTVAPASGSMVGSTSLSAVLTLFGLPLRNQPTEFMLNGVAAGAATTDASGTATLDGVSLAGLAVGRYPGAVRAVFSGVIVLMGACEAKGDLTVTPRIESPPIASDDSYVLGAGSLVVSAPGAHDLNLVHAEPSARPSPRRPRPFRRRRSSEPSSGVYPNAEGQASSV
jgi:hypothetical protein